MKERTPPSHRLSGVLVARTGNLATLIMSGLHRRTLTRVIEKPLEVWYF
jgi:hypothetical protein